MRATIEAVREVISARRANRSSGSSGLTSRSRDASAAMSMWGVSDIATSLGLDRLVFPLSLGSDIDRDLSHVSFEAFTWALGPQELSVITALHRLLHHALFPQPCCCFAALK